ncbi:hypothetical protein ANANG_G00138180 [Anguilla anguilla]|uniref:ZP domain-containing protein n=1 Tax=Anguilla anguilla TaxID=7936 RepID=A0A9D3RW74_ANGAN|nr:hypothetical protein ANANG_G00138180 [Anguilla anguilla]
MVYSSYYSEVDYPVTQVLREPVYVEVRVLERTDPNIVLTLEHCWATSTSSPLSLPQSLLVNGCPYHGDQYLTTLVPVDGSSGLQYPTHYKRFIVQMFTFVDATSLLKETKVILLDLEPPVSDTYSDNEVPQSLGYGLLEMAASVVLVSVLVLAVVCVEITFSAGG